jgi:type 1 glutamine amidotransferase
MQRNLIITGGIYHPFAETSSVLADLLLPLGVQSDIIDDVDAGIDAVEGGEYDLVTVNALRWRMLNNDKYIPYRAEWQFELAPRRQKALSQFIDAGGGLLGLHTASICFDTWEAWSDLLGARWNWDASFHPDPHLLEARPGSTDHVIVRGLKPFRVTDELYHNLDRMPDTEILLEAAAPANGELQALMFAKSIGSGRSVYDSLGHDAASLREPTHTRLLRRSAAWVLGWSDTQVEAL